MLEWLAHTWWTYQGSSNVVYHWFNLLEGCFWLWCGGIVFARYLRNRHSLELWYALSLVPFAVSDFREAYVVQNWLILGKGVNLVAILLLRWIVHRRFYPGQGLMA